MSKTLLEIAQSMDLRGSRISLNQNRSYLSSSGVDCDCASDNCDCSKDCDCSTDCASDNCDCTQSNDCYCTDCNEGDDSD